jgi:D-alanine-D-alanine ligase
MDPMAILSLRIVVLAGGQSAEREISLQSGQSVTESLRARGHQVCQWDPSGESLDDLDPASCDIVLPMVHGTGGEDGTLQRQLTRLRLPFVGSNAVASELTFDKVNCQSALRSAGLPVPDAVVVRRGQSLSEVLPSIKAIGCPLVVKPSRQGSSVGVSIVDRISVLGAAVHVAAEWDSDVLVEQYIPGREFTVPVVDSDILPPVEIIPARGWFDYQAKYMDERTEYRVAPANLPSGLSELAREACHVTGTTGICRVDFRVTDQEDCRILEINTIPGMTSHSLVPMSAAHAGLSIAELCERAIAHRRGGAACPVMGQNRGKVA